MSYTVYEFNTTDEIERSWLISILTDYHFEGFEETEDILKAFAPTEKIKHLDIPQILSNEELNHIPFLAHGIEQKNWNEEWEKNFQPVTIAGRVGIRAPFHEPLNTEYELVIEPKMSFGTGHHATTASVIEMMLGEDLNDKSILDFGSGTGVLAILAEKLKAAKIMAIDHEEWAYRNCVENIERNHCVNIQPVQGDDSTIFTEKFNVLLANINRHVILANLSKWNNLLATNGLLIVSGILATDEQDVMTEAHKSGLNVKNIIRNNGWLAISFHHF
jgi:ribosomal protein L11 methyltransferase